ncbi:hypothetical protein G4B88_002238 [Cannabis sativa]|uniref:Uncharacterized protein n=1 Tax=Cannabis sativa TaxID=3483 RepID=A0A7J6FSN0_CANSA|nr:hypothetical protein G4B88_002238 [Cannabis sativa]
MRFSAFSTLLWFAGEPREMYHCVLESKSFLEKMTVLEHTFPFFLPVREAEIDLLSSNAIVRLVSCIDIVDLHFLLLVLCQFTIFYHGCFQKFIDYIGELSQAYVDRREQVCLVKELYGNQLGEICHSLSYQMIEFSLYKFDWSVKVTVAIRYVDLVSVLPSHIKVLAWPIQQPKKNSSTRMTMKRNLGIPCPTSREGNEIMVGQTCHIRLFYAEDALRSMSLPEGQAYFLF